MTKATDKIQELIEEINDTGLSGSEGIYKYVSFEVHHKRRGCEPDRSSQDEHQPDPLGRPTS